MTFVKLWANRSNLEVRSSVKSYLFQTTKNTMIDYIRKNKNILNAKELENSIATEFIDEQNENLDPYIIRAAVEKCLNNLKPKAREIFNLNKFEGLTYEEIAEYMKISKRSVEDNMSKIMIYLKEELKNHPDIFN